MFANFFKQNIPKTLFVRYILKVTFVLTLLVVVLVMMATFSKSKPGYDIDINSNDIPIIKKSIVENDIPKNEAILRDILSQKEAVQVNSTQTVVFPKIASQTKPTTKPITKTTFKPTEPILIETNQPNTDNDPLLSITLASQMQIAESANKSSIKIREAVRKNEILSSLERIVHIDLKGAPPKMSYFESFLPLLRENGATGILLEYEETFPFSGNLAEAKHTHAYTMNEVNYFKKLCKDNNLYIVPLVQTYGHLEWLLKLKKFKHLRDNARYPQVITQCLNESYSLIYDMLDQVISAHQDSPYFHIGCDEVYYKLMHESCAKTNYTNNFPEAFMLHLVKIASHVRSKMPHAHIMFWNDMLNNIPTHIFDKYRQDIMVLELEPMIWAYVLDVKKWFTPDFYVQYGKNFKNVWAASAYKGASGELATATSITERNANHRTWMEIIMEKNLAQIVNFKGIALTGWSRYDHFLTLCDILPQAVPSIVFNLQTVKHGSLNQFQINTISDSLGCSYQIPWSLEEMRYFNHIQCNFTGNELYKVVISLEALLPNIKEHMEFAKKYMSPMNMQYNYIHKARADEVLPRIKSTYLSLNQLKNNFLNFGHKYYHEDTLNEWLLVYLVPYLDPIYEMILSIKNNESKDDWKPRALNITIKHYPDSIE